MKNFLGFLLVAPLLAAHGSDIIMSVSIGHSSAWGGRNSEHIVNGNGMNPDGITHQSDAANNKMWMNNSTSESGLVSQQWLIFNLNGLYEIDTMKLWNFNWVGYTERGLKSFRLYSSTAASNAAVPFSNAELWTEIPPPNGTVWEIGRPDPGTDSYAGEAPLSLGNVKARWIGLQVVESYDPSSLWVGLSEVKFSGDETFMIHEIEVTSLADTSATFSASIELAANATQQYTTSFLWRPDNSATWLTNVVGETSAGAAHASVNGLAPDTAYACKFIVAADSGENVIEGDVFRFDTGVISAAFSADSMPEASAQPVALAISRPASCVRAARVALAISGAAQPGIDYAPEFPAFVDFAEGQASTNLVFHLIDAAGVQPDRAISVSVADARSASRVDATSTAVFTILDSNPPMNISAWKYSMPLDFGGSANAIASADVLTNFVAAIRLSENIPGFSYANCKPDGADLRFTDDSYRQLPHEIEAWNAAGESLVWVAIPAFDLQNPPVIHALWGNRSATAASAANIWLDGFNAVYHLRDATDASPFANHGTTITSATVPGLLGSAQFFNNPTPVGGGNYERILVPGSASIGSDLTRALTLSMWINPAADMLNDNTRFRMLEKENQYFLLEFNEGVSLGMLVKHNNNNYLRGIKNDIPANQWLHVCGQFDGATLRFYINGEEASYTATSTTIPGALDSNNSPLAIGSDWTGNASTETYFYGHIDEVRIERAVRSPDWIRLCYENQKPDAAIPFYGKVAHPPLGTVIFIR